MYVSHESTCPETHNKGRVTGRAGSSRSSVSGNDAEAGGVSKPAVQPPFGSSGAVRQPVRELCKCSQCGVKWRYNKSEATWQERPSSKRLPLPQPSDSASARRPAWAVKALPIPEASSSSTTPPTSSTFYSRPRSSAKDHLKPGRKSSKTRKAHDNEEGKGEERGLRLGSGHGQLDLLKKGTQSWLTGHLRQAQKDLEREVSAYDVLPVHRNIHGSLPKIDVLEIFAGTSRVGLRPQCPAAL